MKILVKDAFNNITRITEVHLDETCDTEDELRVTINTSKLKTCKVEKVEVKQWREITL